MGGPNSVAIANATAVAQQTGLTAAQVLARSATNNPVLAPTTGTGGFFGNSSNAAPSGFLGNFAVPPPAASNNFAQIGSAVSTVEAPQTKGAVQSEFDFLQQLFPGASGTETTSNMPTAAELETALGQLPEVDRKNVGSILGAFGLGPAAKKTNTTSSTNTSAALNKKPLLPPNSTQRNAEISGAGEPKGFVNDVPSTPGTFTAPKNSERPFTEPANAAAPGLKPKSGQTVESTPGSKNVGLIPSSGNATTPIANGPVTVLPNQPKNGGNTLVPAPLFPNGNRPIAGPIAPNAPSPNAPSTPANSGPANTPPAPNSGPVNTPPAPNSRPNSTPQTSPFNNVPPPTSNPAGNLNGTKTGNSGTGSANGSTPVNQTPIVEPESMWSVNSWQLWVLVGGLVLAVIAVVVGTVFYLKKRNSADQVTENLLTKGSSDVSSNPFA